MLFVSKKQHTFGEPLAPLLAGGDIIDADKWLNCWVSQLLIRYRVVKCPLDCTYVCTGSCVEIADEMRYCGSA